MTSCMHSLFWGRAATAGGGQVEGHDDSAEQLLEVVPANVRQQRANVMFSGATGAVVASGDGKATIAPSRVLCRDVILAVDALPGELIHVRSQGDALVQGGTVARLVFWPAPLRLLDSTAVGVGAAVCVPQLFCSCFSKDVSSAANSSSAHIQSHARSRTRGSTNELLGNRLGTRFFAF